MYRWAPRRAVLPPSIRPSPDRRWSSDPGPALSPDPGHVLGRDSVPHPLLTGLSPSSFQNFVQIISNLLAEENRDKWEEAQLVGMPVRDPCGQSSRMGTGLSGGSLSPRPAQGGVLGSNPSTASASLVTLRTSLILPGLGFPARQRTHHAGLGEGHEKTCWPWGTHRDVAFSHLEKLVRLPSSQADLEPANTPVPRAAPGVGTAVAGDPPLSSQLDPWPPGWSAAAPLGSGFPCTQWRWRLRSPSASQVRSRALRG